VRHFIYQEEEDKILELFKTKKYTLTQISETLLIPKVTITKFLITKNLFPLYFFKNIDCEEKAYWLGFIEADGCINEQNNSRKLVISLSKNDKDHLQKFADLFYADVMPTKEQVCVQISSKRIYNDLIKHGIEPQKSSKANKFQLLNIQEDLINHVIRGIFDGDGWISHIPSENHSVFGIAGNEELLNQIQEYFVKNNIVERKTKLLKDNNSDSLYFKKLQYGGQIQAVKIATFLYQNATIYLDRKYKIFENIYHNVRAVNNRSFSQFRGVSYHSRDRRWRTTITSNKKQKTFYFKNELEAAQKYDIEQVRLFGETAKIYINFPEKFDEIQSWINEGN